MVTCQTNRKCVRLPEKGSIYAIAGNAPEQVTAALAREIAAVEVSTATRYRRRRDLQPTKPARRQWKAVWRVGPLVELNPEAAMAIYTLETRLDQLKEIQQWAKIDHAPAPQPRSARLRPCQFAAKPNAPIRSGLRLSALTWSSSARCRLWDGCSLALPPTILLGH
jgi:hypothetical protein